jgi:hypothetical protein
MALHPLKKNQFQLQDQRATAQQTFAIANALLQAMLDVEEDTQRPVGLRAVGRAAITDIQVTLKKRFDEVTAELNALIKQCEDNLTLPETGEDTDVLDATITGKAIAQMSLVTAFGSLVFKALEHLPKLNKQAPAALVSTIVTALTKAS